MLILESVFYLKNGISINELSFIQKHDDMFYIESVDKNQEKRYSFDGDSLLEEIDLQLVSLYDRFRDLFLLIKISIILSIVFYLILYVMLDMIRTVL